MLQLLDEKGLVPFGPLALQQVRLRLALASPGGTSNGIDDNGEVERALQHSHIPQQLSQASICMAAAGREQHKGKIRPGRLLADPSGQSFAI